MGKKIGLGIEQAVKQELTKRKIIKLKIGGEEYEVRLKYRLSTEEKTQMFQDLYDIMAELEEGTPELVGVTLAVLQNATDIDFPDDIEDKKKLFVLLSDAGYLQEIFTAIPDRALQDIGEFIKAATDYAPEMLKRLKIEEIATEESIDE